MQERFIRAYLDSALALQHCTGFVASDRTEAALEEAAAQLLQAANAYIPMSHLIWGLWGLLQVCLCLGLACTTDGGGARLLTRKQHEYDACKLLIMLCIPAGNRRRTLGYHARPCAQQPQSNEYAWDLQARTSNVPDFDFTMYAEQRLEQYHGLKRL